MGLDMYINAKRYVSTTFNEGDNERAEAIQKLFPELKGMKGRWGDNSPVKEVMIDAGYWRKANAIHKWFVENVQSGKDDCEPHYVSREDLEKLKTICTKVLQFKHLATGLLPTAEGFFFGDTKYDEWYYKDVEDTIKIIDDCLALPNSWEFEYRSSW